MNILTLVAAICSVVVEAQQTNSYRGFMKIIRNSHSPDRIEMEPYHTMNCGYAVISGTTCHCGYVMGETYCTEYAVKNKWDLRVGCYFASRVASKLLHFI